MNERGEPNWQPVDMLPVLANVVAEMLGGAAEQERLLSEAPRYSLDTATLDRVERVYRDGAADHCLYREQAARWQRSHPGTPGLAEFTAGAGQLDPAYQRVLALAAQRRSDTIEALHAKSDLRVGMEALLGGPVETGVRGRDSAGEDIVDELFADEDDARGCSADVGEEARRHQCAALVFDLIGGYVDDDADRVAQIAGQVGATGRASADPGWGAVPAGRDGAAAS